MLKKSIDINEDKNSELSGSPFRPYKWDVDAHNYISIIDYFFISIHFEIYRYMILEQYNFYL